MPDSDSAGTRLLPVHGTRLHVVERGSPSAFPLICLHGRPGEHDAGFANRLDPLVGDGRYRLVVLDQRGQGGSAAGSSPQTWTLHQLASDVSAVAADLGVDDYAVLGHGYAALVALQHAVDAHGAATASVASFPPDGAELAGLQPRLAEVPQPVLVLSDGDADRLAALLPAGQAGRLASSFADDPDGYCAAVRGFLDRSVG